MYEIRGGMPAHAHSAPVHGEQLDVQNCSRMAWKIDRRLRSREGRATTCGNAALGNSVAAQARVGGQGPGQHILDGQQAGRTNQLLRLCMVESACLSIGRQIACMLSPMWNSSGRLPSSWASSCPSCFEGFLGFLHCWCAPPHWVLSLQLLLEEATMAPRVVRHQEPLHVRSPC